MRKFRCPKCQHEVIARATEVLHNCKSNKNTMTKYVFVREEEE